ncbi:hypothetical protein [Candidatus Mycolicibacterium alkanivorans]|uniref:Uncharacterized protein n=1 Tax=Candidatus Mycolicibacterium alkanivorans TaxID=2954114 RepID=A0ABS9YX81_9MYCO|nr:hypothetical protein [Candidatus Mycolicibacterium alkanivorans]MCI4675811.1 hypothetical protein [Candidatus Mycolicibacterium alkanivorans]
MPDSDRQRPDSPPPTPAVSCKLIVAAEAPWAGEIYGTYPGRLRLRFSTLETFCSSLLAVTGWSIDATSPQKTDRATTPERTHSGRRKRCQPKPPPPYANPSTKRKFIIATHEPWSGEIYRTRPGLKHFHFGSFEGFLRAVLDITDWTLEPRNPLAAGPVIAEPTFNRPISGR